MIAITEVCNTLLAADALDALQALQGHEDATVAAAAAKLFEDVIPRIWSF